MIRCNKIEMELKKGFPILFPQFDGFEGKEVVYVLTIGDQIFVALLLQKYMYYYCFSFMFGLF